MYNSVHQYDLSFVPPQRRPKTKPQLVITLSRVHQSELNRRLHILAEGTDIEGYLGRHTPFYLIESDLFGKVEFGFGKCGFLTTTDEEIELRIELSEQTGLCALTLNLLAQALVVPFEQGRRSNRMQQVDLETCCSRPTMHGYEHAVGGYISESVREWLRRQAGLHTPSTYGFTPLPQAVVSAMRHVWAAVAPKRLKEWAWQCGGFVAKDGRFSLQCFGNACDIGVYPDQLSMGTLESVRFGCHNLDTAPQQLTLVCGLAKLCELARQEE